MTWHVGERGFLPPVDPATFVTNTNHRFIPLAYTLENLAVTLPELCRTRRVREELVHSLRSHISCYTDDIIYKIGDDRDIERLHALYCFFASAYVHAPAEATAERIPKEIAIPLVRTAQKVGRMPSLGYASYILTNWKRKDQRKPFGRENVEPIQLFTWGDDRAHEEALVLGHVMTEYAAAPAIQQIARSAQVFAKDDVPALAATLAAVLAGLKEITAELTLLTARCDPEIYHRRVGPHVAGFRGVVYEGCFDDRPQHFDGDILEQSCAVPAMLAFMGMRSTLSRAARESVPIPHRRLLEDLEARAARGRNVREFVKRHPEFKPVYNEILEQAMVYRSLRLEQAPCDKD